MLSPPVVKESKPFALPLKNENMRRVYAYLLNQRDMLFCAAWAFVAIALYWEERGWMIMRYFEQFMEHIEYAFSRLLQNCSAQWSKTHIAISEERNGKKYRLTVLCPKSTMSHLLWIVTLKGRKSRPSLLCMVKLLLWVMSDSQTQFPNCRSKVFIILYLLVFYSGLETEPISAVP